MRIIRALLILTLVAATVHGQTCPSSKAAKAGISPFETFHVIMHPAWHTAYPAKDYAALVTAAPEFEKAFVAIAELEAKMKNPVRKASFLENREAFASFVKQYAEAAKTGDSLKVYEIMPKLHESFEMTASACLPTPYPELEALTVTTHIIVEKHLPADNTEGITGSTETLVTKVQALTQKSLPESLKTKKGEILPLFTGWGKIAAQLKECCDKKDMTNYKKLVDDLSSQIDGFSEKYL
ncbi:MAG: hypothetical protein AB1644_03705 [Candidatus Zixiibacteriota bacterium]